MRSLLLVILSTLMSSFASSAEKDLAALQGDFDDTVLPFLKSYCLNCHGTSKQEAKLNLSSFTSLETVRADLKHWELVLGRLTDGDMPPEEAEKRPSQVERDAIVNWIQNLRIYEATQNAGDPGIVLARRLNNTEYDNTIRDLTGVDIRPTREFPVDPANVAGFANSGESLNMSPSLFNKYLAAARHVADHLVLMPSGFDFAPHPAVIYSDKDKFAVFRIIDFYRTIETDYADFLLAAWEYRHRDTLGQADQTLDQIADAHNLSRKYLATLWAVLTDGKTPHGPIAELRKRWDEIPAPENQNSKPPVKECRSLRNWIIQEREQRQFSFPLAMIPELNPSTQPGILWKNRLISEHRRLGKMTEEEQNDADLRHAIERFCDVFPDKFLLSERGRMNLPFEKQNKGRYLSAGFHLQVGYYRDDEPLYDLILNEQQQKQLDQLWQDLYFVTEVPIRQFQDYIYFERAEGREIITEVEFDFARGDDRSITSQENMEKFADLYVSAVRKRELEPAAIAEIEKYFVEQSKFIRAHERAKEDAESLHLRALLAFALKAWRRPVSDSEQDELLDFYSSLRDESELSHEDAIRDVVVSILVSPYFCYRADVAENVDGKHQLTNHSLASRLSYFLWSSMPDQELMQRAAAGDLQSPGVLETEVERMLKDERSQALAIEFAGNWLDYRQFENHVGVDRTKFTQFSDELRESMFQEPVRFISDLIQRDGSVRELLEAEHTFLDERLAEHYQIPYSSRKADDDGWIRIDNAQQYGRGGLLPMAVFLTKSSPGLRTSPVKRGYWVVKQLLGEHIPAPPANVPELPADESDLGALTLREVLAKHREVKSCAVCHEKFDFAGLVFEGYGPIGERRDQDLGGKPIDDSTVFPDGTTGRGLAGLRAFLLEQRQRQFEDNLCRKLLVYGLGRSLLLSDEPTIDQMNQTLIEENGRFSALVKAIVTSPQFRNKRPDEEVNASD